MKNIAVINAVFTAPQAFRPLAGKESAADAAVAFAGRLPDTADIAVLTSHDHKVFAPYRRVKKTDWDGGALLAALKDLSRGYDNVFYFFADCPFLDPALARRMYENHLKYFSDYTFADGYPVGLAVEIVKSPVFEPLVELCREGDPANRETLFETLKRDINAFDLETEISPVDCRMLRVSLTADTNRNVMLLERLAAAGARDEQSIVRAVKDKPELLRTLPAYFPIQIVEGCPQVCSYCPYPKFGGDISGKKSEMAPETFRRIVAAIEEFAGDAVIGLSLWGEPALHSAIEELIGFVCSRERMTAVVETSGIGWDLDRFTAAFSGMTNPPDIIVSLDALHEPLYRALRGEGFQTAVDTARKFLKLFPGRVHVQAVRMQENEEALEEFYREWKKETDRVIIQKYNHFAGFLPDRKVTDLSPLTRIPCWHVKRDLPVLIDGTVPLCAVDVEKRMVLGNVLTDPLSEIWSRGERWYALHVKEEFPTLCGDCDEYYTYNF
ncbi:MAG TPA: spiro-SPASM protein [Spirochaetia bacterium]|mgnify:CR=1 FL=1|nr:spiro-SPASM protein [Spirochaetia bacterium]